MKSNWYILVYFIGVHTQIAFVFVFAVAAAKRVEGQANSGFWMVALVVFTLGFFVYSYYKLIKYFVMLGKKKR
jgi:hypothetical protein